MKLQHWRGFRSKSGCNSAPVLVFCLLLNALATASPSEPPLKLRIETEVVTRGAPGGWRQMEIEVGRRFAVIGARDSGDDYQCRVDLHDATTFILFCEISMTRTHEGKTRVDRNMPRIYGQLGHMASFFISDKDNQPITGLKALVQRIP